MDEEIAEHCVLVAAEEDCSQQRKIYLKTTMSSAMLFGILRSCDHAS
jgi:hypothetical protein